MKLDSTPIAISAKDLPEFLENSQSHLTTATIEPLEPIITASHKKQESAFVVFGTTFVTIFLAEIGDKTQLSTLLMSAESHAPWVVFIGSAAALITTSLLGVLLGSWISSRLSVKTVEKSAGVMLLLISVMLFWDVLQG
ncbi:TMEM165/GDT1 family protein [Nostoc sp. LEGE 06077]|uniref:TMEM165/GDT1 family protein n=1 Tax=Nostoc sp. LEGE 06077 TaxID=915325 RepID=UPI0018807B3A|nr:TMEM165/GDT1 family protein [Nostoc sp. LEGE 06077]MBE9208613.1 TMEM165/GDT1 family protein [Nostoc sp. LEGE 06077]